MHKRGLRTFTSSQQIHTSSQEISTLCSFNNLKTCWNCIFDWLAAAEYSSWTLMIAGWFFATFFFKTPVKQSHSDHRLESLRGVLVAVSGWKPDFQHPKEKSLKKYKQLKITKAEIWLSYSLTIGKANQGRSGPLKNCTESLLRCPFCKKTHQVTPFLQVGMKI